MNSEYKGNNPNWHIEDSVWKARKIKKFLDRSRIKYLTLADVGCGAGGVLDQLMEESHSGVFFSGFDISEEAISVASPRQKERLKF